MKGNNKKTVMCKKRDLTLMMKNIAMLEITVITQANTKVLHRVCLTSDAKHQKKFL